MTDVEFCKFSLQTPDLLRACARAQRFDAHLHETLSVVVLARGCASLKSAHWKAAAREGDVFLFNPFQVHEGGSVHEAVDYHVLYPSARFVTDSLSVAHTAAPWFRPGVLRRSAATRALVEHLGSGEATTVEIEYALQRVLRDCELDRAGVPADGLRAVQIACRLIHDEFSTALTTHELAQRVRLNHCHFIRIFHRVTGLAPRSYLRQIRLAHARAAICAGNELCDIAQATGFCDQAHMTREFRKLYGVTPGRMARDLRPA